MSARRKPIEEAAPVYGESFANRLFELRSRLAALTELGTHGLEERDRSETSSPNHALAPGFAFLMHDALDELSAIADELGAPEVRS